ncbi:MAG: hypothetical protein HY234_14330 [Acidobacteria bacterium]|nr:hypothetical protein [Acidobacteriota bacterium]MBI3664211.1 hypothetical protein [Acidobacteriota bacterium]
MRCSTLLLFLFVSGLLAAPPARAQQPAAAEDLRHAEFKQLAAQLVERRRSGADETEDLQEKTLKLLDAIVLEQLNRPGPRDLAGLNQRLAASLARPGALGESYELVRLGATPLGEVYYAIIVNFSMSGPSAIRFYPPAPQGYRLAARIDRWEFPDFFDEYVELVPIKASDVVFVTVNGRTDELRTGAFAAWRFAEGRFSAVWTTDILERSSYEVRPDGFHLSFCSQNDEQNPRFCRRMMRERYQWDGFAWRRVEQQESDAPRP